MHSAICTQYQLMILTLTRLMRSSINLFIKQLAVLLALKLQQSFQKIRSIKKVLFSIFYIYSRKIIQIYNFIPRMKKTLILLTILLVVISKPLYDFKKSYITNLTPLNFADQVHKYRQNTHYVSVVQFYSESDGFSQGFAAEFDKWTNQYRGIFKIGAVNCDENYALCKKEGVTQYPAIRILAPIPIPVITIDKDITIEKIQKTAAKYLHSNSIEITNGNIHTFLAENPSVPKVLLFTDRPKGTPMMYKGLSVAFEKKLNFGLVRKNQTILTDKYAVKQFPTIMVIKTGEKKPILYKKKQFDFENIFEFLNIYSEQFVPGGGSSLDSSATKQWMTETFPELFDKSARDICLGTQSTLCVIYITKEKPSQQISNIFDALNAKFDRKIDRGAKFKFMWLNGQTQKKWGDIFGYKGQDKVVILNPGKRKRYTTHDGQISKDSISMTLDSISGGNARFDRISELPSFQLRAE